MTDDMRIKVLFFAGLRELTGCSEKHVVLAQPATIRDVWESAMSGEPLPVRVLVARNQEYSKLDATVAQGDEIAFFPPVTGG